MAKLTGSQLLSSQVRRIALIFPIMLALLLISAVLFFANTTSQAQASTSVENSDRLVETITSTVFLPMVTRNWSLYRELGVANQVGAPLPCSGQTCYVIQVTCPQISRSIQATLKVGEPLTPTNPFKGTILFETGWTGTYYWDEATLLAVMSGVEGVTQSDLIAAAQNNADIIANLRADGFRTVQLKWQANWFEAELGHVEGMGSLACRPATVTKWVYENLHQHNPAAPFCATGHSNGASQLAYSLSHYGLSNILSTVVLESGPNWSNIDHACLHDDLAYQAIFADGAERKVIDWGFGFPNNGTGPCSLQDTNYRNAFQEASLIQSSRDYSYPNTMVAFIFGGLDNTTTYDQGQLFYDHLSLNSNALITQTVVPNAPHFVTEVPAGAVVMENTLRTQCILR